MGKNVKFIRLGIALTAAILIAVGLGLTTNDAHVSAVGEYKILAWNDLGMHCYNRDFADLAVLPPYNTLWVQVVKAGDPPTLVTSGITVEYSYADNTYSVGKTNFWSYDKALFGVDLPPNVGLKGKGLSGTMDLSGDHFVAEGIPVTEFSDSAPTTPQPYQLATVVVKDAATGAVLANQKVVTPVSSEMRCDKCHSDNGEAAPNNPTGKVETNILQLHDEEEKTNLMGSRPVLCANCHGSNALGAPGVAGIKNLSNAMHSKHSDKSPNTLSGCYNCHPGPQTKCLRDVMSTNEGMTCISCHGSMTTVASNPNPWLNEPRCDTCHDSGKYNQDQSLYRFSKEHGGLYCEACHDSTHAIAPSREANDAIKFVALQGHNGPLGECSVCHTTPPNSNMGPHGTGTSIQAPTAATNAASAITADGATLNGRVNANGTSTTVTFEYGLTSAYGTSIAAGQSPVNGTTNTAVTKAITGLTPNATYHFRVVATNGGGTTNGNDLTFTTTTNLSSLVLLSPANGSTLLTNRPNFTWQAVGGVTKYNLQVSRYNTFSTTTINATVSTTTFTPPTALPAKTLLYWRVRTRTGTSTYGPWSEVWSFTTANPPPAPILVTPAANALLTTSTVKLDWKDVVMPAGTSFQKYTVQVATNSTFTANVTLTDAATSEYTFGPLTPGTAYYWRVQAYNTLGQYGAWSVIRTFRAAYVAPGLLLPANGATGVALKPTFTWAPTTGATSYSLQVSKNSTFTALVINKSATTPSYTYTLNLTAGTTYYWRVKVNGPFGPSAWSDYFTFTTP